MCKVLEENKTLVLDETDYFCLSYFDDNGVRVSQRLFRRAIDTSVRTQQTDGQTYIRLVASFSGQPG